MSLPKIVLLGGSGMLGHKVLQRLQPEFPGLLCTIHGQVVGGPLSRIPLFKGQHVVEDVDVRNYALLSDLLRQQRPDWVINCVGVIKQRDAAHVHIPAIAINSLLPHQLAELAGEWGGRLIHFSTDCVFSGRRGMYKETDLSDAEDLYGRSKFLGETSESNALTLRTSIIGRELSSHRSLLDWFLSNRGGKVHGYRKSIYSGVTTNHLAEVVCWIIKRLPTLSGIYQVASEPISKYSLLCLIRDAYQLDIEIEPVDGENVDRSMDGSKLRAVAGYQCLGWPQLVRQLAEDPTPYGEWLESNMWQVRSPMTTLPRSGHEGSGN